MSSGLFMLIQQVCGAASDLTPTQISLRTSGAFEQLLGLSSFVATVYKGPGLENRGGHSNNMTFMYGIIQSHGGLAFGDPLHPLSLCPSSLSCQIPLPSAEGLPPPQPLLPCSSLSSLQLSPVLPYALPFE
jgi:hypothetical protein